MTDAPRLEDAVCAFIDSLEDHIEQFTQAIQINELSRFPACSWGLAKLTLTDHLRKRLAQLGAVLEVHHDLLDNCGRTTYLFKITACQDKISECLDILETPSPAIND